ncbi:hypothetical protein G6F57_008164 [Rhizopus arrhizus]|uniref:Uncharacterized protein n=1 Tax=Rhizopus oryzae TaxID=64495 RepID=A0A9P7BTU5_RHIOR|nr:hypothetical protein G6F23_004228 [Rhizopus arrhizus]KAG1426213.1 hypothetical protein G6F58_001596 [Rhizopus delemar]KAG0760251.1 hypothetical protein G6F24_008460 [Rhizopus arrhizus]KAG0786189.1 hypothetical protein G6F21_008765 [Rhizopus arrhizus]KAG0798275.1 hypothetical protein G6F22_004384 [Rhizopus arrhizus]
MEFDAWYSNTAIYHANWIKQGLPSGKASESNELEEEPVNWAAIIYHIKLIQCNPGIDKSNGNRKLTEDGKLVLKQVLPGSLASTAINMLIKNTKITTRGEDAIDHLWKKSASVSKSQIYYIIQKLEFRSSVVAEANQDQRQSLGKRIPPKETMSFDEAISLPEDLYTRLLAKSERISIVGVSQELQEVLDLVLDAATLEEYEEGIEELRGKEANSTKEMKLEINFSVADGAVRCESTDEILILETSSAYNSASDEKVSFDHYEAMFGLLAMMKTIAEE